MYNGVIISIASIHYSVIGYGWFALLMFIIARNFAIVYGIDTLTSASPLTYTNYQEPEGPFELYVVQAAVLECITTGLLPVTDNRTSTLVLFIPISFAFEVIYDFFHYWIHRGMHVTHHSWHKTHHAHVHLKSIVAFYQNFFDLVLSNSIPFLLTERIIGLVYPLSMFELLLMISYKVFIEVAGHSGRSSGRTTSFPQCIWLPRLLGIELYSEDHTMHHQNINCNYAKRFTLWDKVFGTYQPSPYRLQND